MESEGSAVASPTPRSRGRPLLGLVFLLAVAFGLLSTVPFLALALVYGPNTAESIIQADMTEILWLLRSWEFVFFLVFYRLGSRFDFRRQYAWLAALCLAGVFIGALPELISIQAAPGTSSATFGFAFQGVGLGSAVSVIVAFFDNAFQDFPFPFAGLTLAFVIGQARLRVSSGGRLLPPRALALGFAITTTAFLASGIAYVVGSRLAGLSAFVVSPPYNSYAYDFFYPFFFFFAFYFVGKRLLESQGGMVAFAVCVFAAGVLGYLVGDPLAYYLRTFASPGQPFPPFAYGASFLEAALVRGGYVLTLGQAGASLGFVRSMRRRSDIMVA
ncbi:MAG: hypothetical protein OK442_04035 [Thaumarchaeota archaeon]|nr:hypothetical protein [Nitrososphaerota archaeon]